MKLEEYAKTLNLSHVTHILQSRKGDQFHISPYLTEWRSYSILSDALINFSYGDRLWEVMPGGWLCELTGIMGDICMEAHLEHVLEEMKKGGFC